MEGSTPTGMEAVLSATDTISTLLGKVWTIMTSNPLLTVTVAAGLLSIGLAVFRKVKKTAK